MEKDIEDAQIIEEGNGDAPAGNLHDMLSQPTEHKSESKLSTSDWDFEQDSDSQTQAQTQSDPGQQQAAEPGQPGEDSEAKNGKKITDKAKHASARIAVGMLDLFQRSVFTPIHNHKFKKKFTEDEVERLDHVADAEKSSLDEKDIRIRNKWDRLSKKLEKKIKAIPFEEQERKDLEEAFFTYFDFKEKTLPPEWFVGMAVLNAMGKRAIDAFTD